MRPRTSEWFNVPFCLPPLFFPVPDFRSRVCLTQSPRPHELSHACLSHPPPFFFPFPQFLAALSFSETWKLEMADQHAHRWVIFLTGLAYITLPGDKSTSAYVPGGQFGLIFAADTAAVSGTGHNTSYPGITETVALQIPTLDGEIPSHSILHSGPCTANDTLGLLGLAAP